MRLLTNREKVKRGCVYCADRVRKDKLYCVHSECPYRELDKYDTYADYLKYHKHESVDSLIGAVFNMHREL